ncbi:calmodulin-dependent 3',5'-cyclic nucleotide phosphodiesterase 1B [Seminavis robusta]|uniref:Calmodulin-dependent 3',5'-cyclic nucleotide phosphodiesterase 1B n=1 Tax=Seminavis robusta TaxID=568900 RepID=A0A9N8F362_9STRA|nr:calmodulin-dependent 3',5'-cyclic nucleotide phosphodiesterase 1B [Seminavis robusta]|eukprot:Sro3286_g346210.1 calmodulin-dependent 3',5'-cyclic nucleotide phosphodiesterase 1B (415) ;mRNA; f:5609-7686
MAYWVRPTGITRNGSIGPMDNPVRESGSNGSHPFDASFLTSSKRLGLKNDTLKQGRLVNWIVEILKEHLKKLVASRGPTGTSAPLRYNLPKGKTSLDEVAEVIKLPKFSGQMDKNWRQVALGLDVVSQLHRYVTALSELYLPNPFHNFEHAAHVTMATDKFMKRINWDYTHGVNSDPLTLLAIVFSALIHDADHRGVSNTRLAEEEKQMADKYRGKSIAEIHESEMKRFRQVLVNVVLATDIFDKELNGLRKNRWDKAFSNESLSQEENNDLRATIVIEHIMQASDVSHTMQHWHIYRKWNRRLFQELSLAYRQGRMGKDPRYVHGIRVIDPAMRTLNECHPVNVCKNSSEFWYIQGRDWLSLTFYIIPLAKKLKDCRVFGVSSDECLNYAMQNRDEWKERGQESLLKWWKSSD